MIALVGDVAGSTTASGGAPLLELDAFVALSGLEAVVLGSSKDPNAKVTVLLASPVTRRAVYAIKVPMTAGAAGAVEAEAQFIETLPRAVGIATTFPQIVGTVQHRGRTALVTNALTGTPMGRVYLGRGHTASPDRVGRDFGAAAAWLGAFQEATEEGEGPIDFGDDVPTRLKTRFGDDPAILGDLARLADILARLSKEHVPRTAVHGDFWHGNLLVAGGRVTGVVDWEAATTLGEPVRDLVRFAVAYALYLDRATRAGSRVRGHAGLVAGAWGRPIEWALDGTSWFGRAFREFVQDGLVRLGASPGCWRDAVIAGIAEVAALADDLEFARHHLELFRRLTNGPLGMEARSR